MKMTFSEAVLASIKTGRGFRREAWDDTDFLWFRGENRVLSDGEDGDSMLELDVEDLTSEDWELAQMGQH